MNIKKMGDKTLRIHAKKKMHLHVKKESGTKNNASNTSIIRHEPENAGNMAEKKMPESEELKPKKNHIHVVGEKKTAQAKKAVANKKRPMASAVIASSAVKGALNEMEGGSEIYDAYMAADVLAKSVTNVVDAADTGRNLHCSQVNKKNLQNIKKKQSGAQAREKAAPQSVISAASKTAQTAAEGNVKKTKKMTAKTMSKTVAKKTAGQGNVIAKVAAGETAIIARDKRDERLFIRNRMISLFVAKMRQEGKQDSVSKALKDIVLIRFSMVVKYIVRYVGLFLLALFAAVVVIALPIIVIIAVIYNSPFAVFFPSISSGNTVQEVLSGYVSEFNEAVNAELADYDGYDTSEKIYSNSEGSGTPDNFCDILMVYMVEYGDGDTATDMTDEAKQNLKNIFDDMCSYTISNRIDTDTDEAGSTKITTIKEVNVELKSCYDMVSIYGFSADEQTMLAELMKPGNLAVLGYGGGDGDPGEGISPEQYQAIVDAISDENGKKVVAFALSKVGYPYSQRYRDSGKYYDCSSLAYYAWRSAGVSIMYGGSNTAASEGKFCYDHNLLVKYDEMQPGDLIFYSSHRNGRFMNITHVAIYAGNGKVVEAANARLGVVYRSVRGNSSIAFIGRPR